MYSIPEIISTSIFSEEDWRALESDVVVSPNADAHTGTMYYSQGPVSKADAREQMLHLLNTSWANSPPWASEEYSSEYLAVPSLEVLDEFFWVDPRTPETGLMRDPESGWQYSIFMGLLLCIVLSGVKILYPIL